MKNFCPILKDECSFFQELMLNILERRVIFKQFEEYLKEKQIEENNDFLSFCHYGYVISQLSDCRKFFDRNSKAHNFSFVVKHMSDEKIKDEHDKILKKWRNNGLQTIANQHLLHADESAKNLIINMQVLDDFICRLKNYINEIFNQLEKESHSVDLLLYNNYLLERKNEVDIFFRSLKKYE